MSENCSHECSACGEITCGEREQKPVDFRVPLNAKSKVGKVIAVVSGKGGVGKSLVTALLGAAASRAGYKAAVLDADITGPSIPQSFGLKELATGTKDEIFPVRSKTGIAVMSMNLLLEKNTDPVVWRGPILAGTVKQFWSEVVWGDIDYMFVDLPPGTGDVPLTVFQSLPVDGIVVVASPQEMVGMIVEKAIKMAGLMEIPVLALVENMSYFKCPDCGKSHDIFGPSKSAQIAEHYGIDTFCRLPLDPKIASAVDAGEVELVKEDAIQPVMDLLYSLKGENRK
ncbi:MAG: Mrp/NBP35 family ATP-binding protein [Selenomonadaceae bacterium]|nr:Mrp/NBP35 family ATP-binding protein [Selenomonadaceae bacterium]